MGSRAHTSTGAIALGIGLGIGAAAAAALGAALLQSQKSNRETPLSKGAWRAAHDESGRTLDFPAVLEQICRGGCASEVREQVWPVLLRLVSISATAEQQAAVKADLTRRYNDLLQRCQDLETQLRGSLVRTGSGVSITEDAIAGARSVPARLAQFGEAQRIIVLDAVRTDFASGAARTQTAGALNGAINGPAQGGERRGAGPWLGRVAEETLAGASHLPAASKRAAARLMHLLSAYAVHDPETGYCQGMSDLAVPFLSVFEEDAMAFWAFERHMQRVKKLFRHDETGVREQLRALARVLERADTVLFHRLRQIGAGECFFAYRMLLVQAKRELPLAQVLTLWEMTWADDFSQRLGGWATAGSTSANGLAYGGLDNSSNWTGPREEVVGAPQPDLLLFFIAAITLRQRRRLIDECRDQDDALRLFNSLKVDFWRSIRSARAIQQSLASQHQPSSSVY